MPAHRKRALGGAIGQGKKPIFLAVSHLLQHGHLAAMCLAT